MNMRCVALLGRKDTPTDAVEEYCRYLAAALRSRGITLEVARVNWLERGWGKALGELEIVARKELKTWFLVQYTALAWSRRGFSWRVLKVIGLLKKSGARVAIVFHDVEPYFGNRLIDRVRRRVQLRTMRNAMKAADAAILTVAVEKIPWARGVRGKSVFIPVGANLPEPERAWTKTKASGGPLTVGVFSISGGRLGAGEAESIAEAVAYAAEKIGALRIVVLGRNSDTAGKMVSERLAGKPVEIVARGMLSGNEVVNALGSCDAMLFVRGAISSRRGSAIAGIACGLPVIAVEGWETAAPVTEAGVVLVPNASKPDFGPALVRVLQDSKYRGELGERSRGAQRQYFSWQAVADQYAVLLKTHDR
jgi:glycosyltransferase involved in cell wall biosynthesis